MDVIIKVTNLYDEAHHELHRAANRTSGVRIISTRLTEIRLQGSKESFDNLDDRLDEQEATESRYDQYEYARGNRHASTRLSHARRARREQRNSP